MEPKQQTLSGVVLLGFFVVLLGWYFIASYIGHQEVPRVQEKLFTVHDDLLAIEGGSKDKQIAVGKFGLIFLTQDNGKTWQLRPSNTTKALAAVSFADPAHGFIVGSGGSVLASTDGGMNWQPQNSGTKDQLLAVRAVSPQLAFAVGAFGTLISTADGGQAWEKHELKWDNLIERLVKEGGYLEPNLNAVEFPSSEQGWVVGEFGLILHTGDGGKTWVSQRYGSDFPQLYAVKFIDDRRGWAVGQAGNVVHTTDGGKNWSAFELNTKRDLYAIAMEGERGVIAGEGVLFVSGDGGATWKAVSSAEEQSYAGIALKESAALAVGRAGAIKQVSLN